jgi:adenine deaminase
VLALGTTAVVADPHELANVLGGGQVAVRPPARPPPRRRATDGGLVDVDAFAHVESVVG